METWPSSRNKPRVKKRRIHYESLSSLKNQLDVIVQKESEEQMPPHNMIPHQCFVYGVISSVEDPLKPNCYRVRIDDETMSEVLCRIELSHAFPKVGPNMNVGDIIRIHRLTVQIEYDDEKRERQMVLSTSPHHNYTIFKIYESGAIKYKSSARTVSFIESDQGRLRDIARWGRNTFHTAVIESLRIRCIEINETTTAVENCRESVTVEVQNGKPFSVCARRAKSASLIPIESSVGVESLAVVENEQVIHESLCNESETNTKSPQKSLKDSVMNDVATVSNEQNTRREISEIRKNRTKLNNPEKVAAVLNFKLSQLKQMSHSRPDPDHSFPKQSNKSSSSLECNPGSSKSSNGKQNCEDVTVTPAILPSQSINQHQSNLNTSDVHVEVQTVSNEKSDGQNAEDVNPVCSPVKTYTFNCKILDRHHCFEFQNEERNIWLRIIPLKDQIPTFETERFSQAYRQNSIDILLTQVDALSEKDFQRMSEEYINSDRNIQIENVRLIQRSLGSCPLFTMDAQNLVEQIRSAHNLLMDTRNSGDNVEDEFTQSVDQAMELIHTSQEQDCEDENSNNSSYATAMSSLNTSLTSCISQTDSPVDESVEITILDPDNTYTRSHHNSFTSTDKNEDETRSELKSSGVQSIDEVKLANSSPQSYISQTSGNVDREGQETNSESLFPPDTSSTNSQSVSVVTILSEDEELEDFMAETLTKSSSIDSNEEATEMYHSSPPPKKSKVNFNSSSNI